MVNIKMILRIMGVLLVIESLMLIVCVIISIFYKEDDLNAFVLTLGLTGIIGLSLILSSYKAPKQLSRRDGYLIVSLSWIIVSIFGMLPFYLSGYIPNITDAFFESMSGFSSTGCTILDNIEEMPHGILFWRSLTQWIGGLGIIFFTIAVLPLLGVSGIQLFAAEATGIAMDKVHPRIGVTAKWIWSIYIGITLLQIILLCFSSMDFFDNVCHSLATTSTGGLSTKQDSIAYYHSAYIEYIIAFFMILSGVNFTLILLSITGKFKKVLANSELKYYMVSIVALSLAITVGLYYSTDYSLEESFRKAIFQIGSIHTSTGFTTDNYMNWKPVLWGILFIPMLVGACAGSTSGGFKCIRVVLLSKITKNELKRIIHPNLILRPKVNGQIVQTSIQSTVLAFSFVYLLIILMSTLFLLAFDLTLLDSFGIVISSIGNMGPGFGNFGPAFSWSALPDAAKWLSSFLMLIGRLELFTILLMFTPGFWKG